MVQLSSRGGKHKRGVESIDSILKRWARVNQVSRRLDRDSVFQRWKEVVGDDIGDHTRVVDLKGGVLLVEVDSPPLLHELSTYYCEDILESLRQTEAFQRVHELRFRAGTFS